MSRVARESNTASGRIRRGTGRNCRRHGDAGATPLNEARSLTVAPFECSPSREFTHFLAGRRDVEAVEKRTRQRYRSASQKIPSDWSDII
ncbi:hypothetical protein BURKHO8Y_210653 [Burkholderia sp. 8Y]|nr:hypothetical protein BURKHO8Y_210653 [Burkholderia sp. 8Y]